MYVHKLFHYLKCMEINTQKGFISWIEVVPGPRGRKIAYHGVQVRSYNLLRLLFNNLRKIGVLKYEINSKSKS